jgi:hypothetical protein
MIKQALIDAENKAKQVAAEAENKAKQEAVEESKKVYMEKYAPVIAAKKGLFRHNQLQHLLIDLQNSSKGNRCKTD